MTKLEDDMVLYHGSYIPVQNIDLSKCVPYKDFGQGFYVTTSMEQAENFARLSLKRAAVNCSAIE